MLGPQNTPSSRCTLSYTETLFWILQLSPMVTLLPTNTPWPMETFLPMRAPLHTCTKCQTRDPSPIWAPSSTMAESWIITLMSHQLIEEGVGFASIRRLSLG